jgi:hypothetical protein
MTKLMGAFFLFTVLLVLESGAFASTTLNCAFKNRSPQIRGVESIKISENALVINHDLEIPLERSQVRCGHYGRQDRFDGSAAGYKVILKSCTDTAELEGHLIDSVGEAAEPVVCHLD